MSGNSINRSVPPIPAEHGRFQVRGTDRVWLEFVEKSGKIYVWHWCMNAGDGGVCPRWVKMGTGNHVVYVGPDGGSLTPSVHFNECCGLHGWITLGQWVPAGHTTVRGVV